MTVCLCMIVRDESAVIERCLASVRDHIDAYCIIDTGSTDNTMELVERAMEGVPGVLASRPWVNFGANRSEVCDYASACHSDYLLWMDADWTLDAPDGLGELTAPAYFVNIDSGSLNHHSLCLLDASLPWRFEGVVHEYATCDQDAPADLLGGAQFVNHSDGGGRVGRHALDVVMLRDAYRADPDNTRTVFYLAQSCRDGGDPDEALSWYLQRSRMGGWEEEVYVSLLEAGRLYERRDDWPMAADALTRAWQVRPLRMEAVYELAAGYRTRGNYATASVFARLCGCLPPADDRLFVEQWVYDFGLLFESSIAAHHLGDVQGSVAMCDALLELCDLPENYRVATEQNRAMGVAKLEG